MTSNDPVYGRDVNIIYKGSSMSEQYTSANITCTASVPISSRIQIYSIDVRLQDKGESNGTCDFNHTVIMEEHGSLVKQMECQDEKIIGYKDITMTTTGNQVTIVIARDLPGTPQIVWLGLKGVYISKLLPCLTFK